MNTDEEKAAEYYVGRMFDSIRSAMHDAVAAKLSGYQSPLDPIIAAVVVRKREALDKMVSDAFDSAIDDVKIRAQIVEGVSHKIGKELVNKMGGEVEKQVNLLKSNPETRAKITLAIAEIVKGAQRKDGAE